MGRIGDFACPRGRYRYFGGHGTSSELLGATTVQEDREYKKKMGETLRALVIS